MATTKATATKATATATKAKAPSRRVNVTVKPGTTLPKGLVDATIAAFRTTDRVHARRADIVRRYLNAGFSIRGSVAALAIANDGDVPDAFSKGNLEKYAYVIAGLTELADHVTPGTRDGKDDMVAKLYTVAKHGKAPVMDAIARANQCKTPLAALAAIGDSVTAGNRKTVADLTRKPSRPVAGEAADGGKAPAVESGKADTEPATVPAASTLSGLLAAVEARLTAKAAGVTEADLEALERISAAAAALVEAGRLVTTGK